MPRNIVRHEPRTASTRKPELSPSKLRNYLRCESYYKLEYIDRLGKYYHKSRADFSFGSSLHQTLQAFHQQGGVQSVGIEELSQQVIENWRTHGYKSAEEELRYRSEALEIVRQYHLNASLSPADSRVCLTEKTFKFDMGRFILVGRIDRLDERGKDGTLEIVDYKSCRHSVSVEDVRSSLAMNVYQILVKRAYPDRRVLATIHALRAGQSATVELSSDDLNDREEEILAIGHQILDRDFQNVLPQYYAERCDDCDFKRICQRHWNSTAADDQWSL